MTSRIKRSLNFTVSHHQKVAGEQLLHEPGEEETDKLASKLARVFQAYTQWLLATAQTRAPVECLSASHTRGFALEE